MQEQQRRNIFRPWFVDSGCSTHMRGDISHLLIIQIINDGFVSLAGKEKKGKIANGDRKKRCAEKGNFKICFVYVVYYFFVKFVHILPYAQI